MFKCMVGVLALALQMVAKLQILQDVTEATVFEGVY